MELLAVGHDAKTPRGELHGILTGILYMIPAESPEDELNFCPFSTPGCRKHCIVRQGRGQMNNVERGRARKRRLFVEERLEFIRRLERDCAALVRAAARRTLEPAARPNGTSDVAWELIWPSLFMTFPMIQFYDYTKVPARMARFMKGKFPTNYYLTFSRSEDNEAECLSVLAKGGNVAVVFAVKKGQPLPATWHGYRVIDGDLSDVRYLDPRNVVVGLRAKGSAKHDRTGFVVREVTP
jgi:hypothetical protein